MNLVNGSQTEAIEKMCNIFYKIYDEDLELFRVVRTKWERDDLLSKYKNFTYKTEKRYILKEEYEEAPF